MILFSILNLAISPYVSLISVTIPGRSGWCVSSTIKNLGLHVRNNDGMKLGVGRSFPILCLHIEIHQCVRQQKFHLIHCEEPSGTNNVSDRGPKRKRKKKKSKKERRAANGTKPEALVWMGMYEEIPSVLAVPKVEMVMRCIGSMMSCALSVLVPQSTKAEPVKFMWIRISFLIRMDSVDCCSDRGPRRDVNPVAECETISHCIAYGTD